MLTYGIGRGRIYMNMSEKNVIVKSARVNMVVQERNNGVLW